jgi:hypothetical protein
MRLLVGDLALGILLGLIGIVIAPGLAVVAIAALVVLLALGIGAALHARNVRRRRREAPPSIPRETQAMPPLHRETRVVDEESFGSS